MKPIVKGREVCYFKLNVAYATAIARLVYYRHPEPLPLPDDVEALGRYYTKYFNTALGQGSAEEFVRNYKRHVVK